MVLYKISGLIGFTIFQHIAEILDFPLIVTLYKSALMKVNGIIKNILFKEENSQTAHTVNLLNILKWQAAKPEPQWSLFEKFNGYFHLPTQEVFEYPLVYPSSLHAQKLYQVHFVSSTKRDYKAFLKFDRVYIYFTPDKVGTLSFFYLHVVHQAYIDISS